MLDFRKYTKQPGVNFIMRILNSYSWAGLESDYSYSICKPMREYYIDLTICKMATARFTFKIDEPLYHCRRLDSAFSYNGNPEWLLIPHDQVPFCRLVLDATIFPTWPFLRGLSQIIPEFKLADAIISTDDYARGTIYQTGIIQLHYEGHYSHKLIYYVVSVYGGPWTFFGWNNSDGLWISDHFRSSLLTMIDAANKYKSIQLSEEYSVYIAPPLPDVGNDTQKYIDENCPILLNGNTENTGNTGNTGESCPVLSEFK